MESFNHPPIPNNEKLIGEHALLAAEFASTTDIVVQESLRLRLTEIEKVLDLTPHEIAERALTQYKKTY